MDTVQTDHLNMQLQMDDVAISYVKETAKWGKFLSIVGFVTTGLIVLVALFAGTMFSGLERISPGLPGGFSVMITVIYLIIAVLYFFPCYYLYKFSNKAKYAIEVAEQGSFNEALGNLKSCFKFVGIMTIVVLSIYALLIIIVMITAAFSTMN